MDHRVTLASLLFGFGSWITITGFWAELPLLIKYTPEGWKLPSKLAIFIQAANLGPFLYFFARKYSLCSYVQANHLQLFIGCVCCLGLIGFWDLFVTINGSSHSLILFLCVFGLSLTDATSSVTFLPFMAQFKEFYLTPYLIGEGLSGFIPIVVAWCQGVPVDVQDCDFPDTSNGTNSTSGQTNVTIPQHRFPPAAFFTSLLITLLISWAAFFYLLKSKTAKNEQLTLDYQHNAVELKTLSGSEKLRSPNNVYRYRALSNQSYHFLQSLIVYCCLLTFGLAPAIQSYSTLNYGYQTLHYVVLLGGLSYPVGCLLAMVVNTRSLLVISWLTVIGTIIGTFIFTVAVLSPDVPLNYPLTGSVNLGGLISVISWCLFIGVLSYVKTVITTLLNESGGEKALFWVGMATQIGSLIGAGLMYLLINYTRTFKDNCDN